MFAHYPSNIHLIYAQAYATSSDLVSFVNQSRILDELFALSSMKTKFSPPYINIQAAIKSYEYTDIYFNLEISWLL